MGFTSTRFWKFFALPLFHIICIQVCIYIAHILYIYIYRICMFSAPDPPGQKHQNQITFSPPQKKNIYIYRVFQKVCLLIGGSHMALLNSGMLIDMNLALVVQSPPGPISQYVLIQQAVSKLWVVALSHLVQE